LLILGSIYFAFNPVRLVEGNMTPVLLPHMANETLPGFGFSKVYQICKIGSQIKIFL